jgi:hypothetical protein
MVDEEQLIIDRPITHDVFISYSTKDKSVTDGICANLEAAGIRCWIAPRDIAAGEDWPSAIANAIPHCSILVLVFSADSNRSKQVGREIALAANNDLVIIPFRIEKVLPAPGMDFYLLRTHWLEAANPPTQDQVNILLDRTKAIINQILVTERQKKVQESERQELINSFLSAWLRLEERVKKTVNFWGRREEQEDPFEVIKTIFFLPPDIQEKIQTFRKIHDGLVHGDKESIKQLSSSLVQKVDELTIKLGEQADFAETQFFA